MTYDSRPETRKHIEMVRANIAKVIESIKINSVGIDNPIHHDDILLLIHVLEGRAKYHDSSKLEEPELSIFNEYTPKLKGCTYGSDEYKGFLEGMGVALEHHYEHNSHHPEYHAAGYMGMSHVDIIEMICDWEASTHRHADGDIIKSIKINQGRFGYSDITTRLFTEMVENVLHGDGANDTGFVGYTIFCIVDDHPLIREIGI